MSVTCLHEPARLLRVFQGLNQIGERAIVDAPSTLRGSDGERDREMRLAHARWPEQDDILAALDEAERVQTFDLLAFDTRLKREIKIGERLRHGQARRAHRRFQPAIIAQRNLRAEQHFERRRRLELPAIERAENVIERFECAGQFEIGELRPEPIAEGRRSGGSTSG